MPRKLAAILSADVKGYSRLMADNENATIKTLTAYRRIIAQLVQQQQGRVVDSSGDNLLVEFASAVNAVCCAVAIQERLKIENQNLARHRRMEFRIGVNLGDVVSQRGAIYGDGVNLAARIEGLADPGGVCVSASIHEQVKNKLRLSFADHGKHQVKNIAEPVRVFQVLTDHLPAMTEAELKLNQAERAGGRKTRILLVDDHEVFRSGIRSLLNEEDDLEVVAEAADGREAVLMTQRHQPDVVLMDISMPDLNGIEATRKIVETGGPSRVLVLSMHSDPRFVAGVLEAGAHGYLIKTCTAREMLAVIRLVGQGLTYLTPEITDMVVKGFVGRMEGSLACPPASSLSPREREVLQLLAEGLSVSEISQRLGLGEKTIKAHRHNLMEKLNISNMVGLVRYALREKVCSLDSWLSS
ncbi:MAG: response regulator [Deltaproteobacteria bacterium]|nr:response regulator [Deltaproteobacteria bacterium]